MKNVSASVHLTRIQFPGRCNQSSNESLPIRSLECWSVGVLEYWIFHHSISPLLHCSASPATRPAGVPPTSTPSRPSPPAALEFHRARLTDPPPLQYCAAHFS